MKVSTSLRMSRSLSSPPFLLSIIIKSKKALRFSYNKYWLVRSLKLLKIRQLIIAYWFRWFPRLSLLPASPLRGQFLLFFREQPISINKLAHQRTRNSSRCSVNTFEVKSCICFNILFCSLPLCVKLYSQSGSIPFPDKNLSITISEILVLNE